jgi:hypothetical protein
MKNFLTLTLLGAALTASTALGAIVTYTNAAAFNASSIVGGTATVTEDFNTNDSLFTTFDIQGTNGTTPGFGGGERTSRVTGSYSEIVTLDAGNMTAFGGTWNLAPAFGLGAGLRLTITLAAGGTQIVTPVLGHDVGDGTTPFFFGFTSTEAFTSVTISQGGRNGLTTEGFNLDNLLVEQAGAVVDPPVDPPPPGEVPEPSTFGLMGIAMVGLGMVRRFRR